MMKFKTIKKPNSFESKKKGSFCTLPVIKQDAKSSQKIQDLTQEIRSLLKDGKITIHSVMTTWVGSPFGAVEAFKKSDTSEEEIETKFSCAIFDVIEIVANLQREDPVAFWVGGKKNIAMKHLVPLATDSARLCRKLQRITTTLEGYSIRLQRTADALQIFRKKVAGHGSPVFEAILRNPKTGNCYKVRRVFRHAWYTLSGHEKKALEAPPADEEANKSTPAEGELPSPRETQFMHIRNEIRTPERNKSDSAQRRRGGNAFNGFCQCPQYFCQKAEYQPRLRNVPSYLFLPQPLQCRHHQDCNNCCENNPAGDNPQCQCCPCQCCQCQGQGCKCQGCQCQGQGQDCQCRGQGCKCQGQGCQCQAQGYQGCPCQWQGCKYQEQGGQCQGQGAQFEGHGGQCQDRDGQCCQCVCCQRTQNEQAKKPDDSDKTIDLSPQVLALAQSSQESQPFEVSSGTYETSYLRDYEKTCKTIAENSKTSSGNSITIPTEYTEITALDPQNGNFENNNCNNNEEETIKEVVIVRSAVSDFAESEYGAIDSEDMEWLDKIKEMGQTGHVCAEEIEQSEKLKRQSIFLNCIRFRTEETYKDVLSVLKMVRATERKWVDPIKSNLAPGEEDKDNPPPPEEKRLELGEMISQVLNYSQHLKSKGKKFKGEELEELEELRQVILIAQGEAAAVHKRFQRFTKMVNSDTNFLRMLCLGFSPHELSIEERLKQKDKPIPCYLRQFFQEEDQIKKEILSEVDFRKIFD